MSSHEGEGDQSPASQVLMNEVIDGFTIFEATKQCRKTIGLIVQGNIASCTSVSVARLVSANAPAWATRSWSMVSFVAFDWSAQKLSAIEFA
jgi:hypothetical protein